MDRIDLPVLIEITRGLLEEYESHEFPVVSVRCDGCGSEVPYDLAPRVAKKSLEEMAPQIANLVLDMAEEIEELEAAIGLWDDREEKLIAATEEVRLLKGDLAIAHKSIETLTEARDAAVDRSHADIHGLRTMVKAWEEGEKERKRLELELKVAAEEYEALDFRRQKEVKELQERLENLAAAANVVAGSPY